MYCEQTTPTTLNDKVQPKIRQRIKPNSRILPTRAVEIMTEWYDRNYTNPYPSYREFELMASQGGITTNQVKQWFVNTRRRTKNEFRRQNMTYRNKKRSVEFSYQLVEDIVVNQSMKIQQTSSPNINNTQHQYFQPTENYNCSSYTSYSPILTKAFDDSLSSARSYGSYQLSPTASTYNNTNYYFTPAHQESTLYFSNDSYLNSSLVPSYSSTSSCNSSVSNYGFTCDFSTFL